MADPVTFTVTLDLDKALTPTGAEYDHDGDLVTSGEPQTLESLVFDQVVRMLVNQVAADQEWARGMRSRISDIRDGIVTDLLTPILTEAVEASVQPTNTMGQGVCEPTTLHDIIVEKGKAWLGENVDRGGYGNRQTRLDKIIADAVGSAFQRDLLAAVEAGKREILDAVKVNAADMLAKTIAKMAQGG